MRIIDINAAVGAPTRGRRFQDAAGLVEWLNEYRISAALAYHAEAFRSPWKGNEEMAKVAAASEGRIKLCLALNPSLMEENLPGAGDLRARLAAMRPAAVRVFPTNNAFLLDKFYARDLLEVMNALRMPLVVDGSYDNVFFTSLPDTAEAFPDVRFILLRCGFNKSRFVNPLLKYRKNVYFDMSVMLDLYQIEEIVKRFGSERLLFGSGLPDFEPSGALGLLMYAAIPEADRENIAHGNFERLEAEIRHEL